MDPKHNLALLGGLSPARFMKRHWQKAPLLVRGAVPGIAVPLARRELFALASRDDIQSRLVTRDGKGWRLRHGPFSRRAIPPPSRPGWTLLVQGVDLAHPGVHALLRQFRFVPDARLDDLMISYASDGGGVGPHVDSYDVFLLQAQGRRRWRIGHQSDLTLQAGLPLKVLARFEPQDEYLLEPGDMLYLPPGWAHDGTAQGECQTYSIGFRAPGRCELAHELLQRLADVALQSTGEARYSDRGGPATGSPGAIPAGLQRFAQRALKAVLKEPRVLERALGEYLTEPKPQVWFPSGTALERPVGAALELDRRTRMMYDAKDIFINGESCRAVGNDAVLMRRLSDLRCLEPDQLVGASAVAMALFESWAQAGWLHEREDENG